MYMSKKENNEESSLSKQRLAALSLKKEEPYVTKVEFIGEGEHPGVGASWVIGAKATMGGEVFDISLGTEGNTAIHFLGNEGKKKRYDEITNKELSHEYPLEVIYSNGKHEVLE
ncbi:hypothetical protein LACDD01_02141 [Lactococcus sp. DD01]|nr:hypothetical protein LACDD01_02141 [Lactococcus sp. DD01]